MTPHFMSLFMVHNRLQTEQDLPESDDYCFSAMRSNGHCHRRRENSYTFPPINYTQNIEFLAQRDSED